MKNALVQIYTGNGKGKTTAALGLALRASGAGLKVCVCQFVKGKLYNEIKALKKLKNVYVYQCGRSCFVNRKPEQADRECASRGLARARKIIMSGRFDVVVLDEINIALDFGLIRPKDIVDMIKNRPDSVELILTGRYCPPVLFRYADLVTEMKEVKHPYRKGVLARRGIEY